MATVRNIAGDARWIPYANAVVEDGETFEVDDEHFDHMDFHADLFKVVTPPVGRPKAAKKTAARKRAAAKKTAAAAPPVVADPDVENPNPVGDAAPTNEGQ